MFREINAWPLRDGSYRIEGDTYNVRDVLKQHGARWENKCRAWFGSREVALAVRAKMRVRVRVAAHCHEEERDISVTEEDVAKGFVRLGCGWCDTSYRCGDDVKILKVYDMPEQVG